MSYIRRTWKNHTRKWEWKMVTRNTKHHVSRLTIMRSHGARSYSKKWRKGSMGWDERYGSEEVKYFFNQFTILKKIYKYSCNFTKNEYIHTNFYS